jgi:hypothetical protein
MNLTPPPDASRPMSFKMGYVFGSFIALLLL